MPDTLSRILLTALILLVYFFLLRPIRGEINQTIFPLVEQSIQESDSQISYSQSGTVSNRIEWGDISNPKELYLKIPFGLNFLIGIIGLILVKAENRYYWILAAIQLGGGIVAFASFYFGTVSSANFLIITDLIMRYLMPLCSLGIVPLAFIQKRQ
ncbi:MAG: hypothetical protein WD059_01895 [Balneolaceae bacterium]